MTSTSLAAAAGVLVGASTLILPIGAAASASTGSLPTLKVALNGTKGITVSGDTVSGAVNVVSTFSGHLPQGPEQNGPVFGLVRLRSGVSFQQAYQAVGPQGDLNALTPYAKLFVSAGAPSTVQTVLAPGNYVAVNMTGNANPGFALFSVTQSPSPATLPLASATQRAVDFGFRGPTVLHNGTTVRAVNDGWLVHMVILAGVRDEASGRQAVALLRSGKDNDATKLMTNNFVALLGPASHGALQQQVLHAKPGYYVEGCLMDTQDGRAHSELGMERLVQVVG